MITIKKKVIVITGATGGTGRAVAHMLAEKKSYALELVARDKKALLSLKNTLLKRNRSIGYSVCDLGNEDTVAKVIKTIYRRAGRVDALINCAGKFHSKKVDQISSKEWHDVFISNVEGVFNCCKNIVPIMKKQKSGVIISLASIGGVMGLAERTAYCASKYALVGFLKALAKEVKKNGIKVHIIYPYLVDSKSEIAWMKVKDTEKTILRPSDIARVIAFLMDLPARVQIEDLEVKPSLY